VVADLLFARAHLPDLRGASTARTHSRALVAHCLHRLASRKRCNDGSTSNFSICARQELTRDLPATQEVEPHRHLTIYTTKVTQAGQLRALEDAAARLGTLRYVPCTALRSSLDLDVRRIALVRHSLPKRCSVQILFICLQQCLFIYLHVSTLDRICPLIVCRFCCQLWCFL
jgi:hypothetical protein